MQKPAITNHDIHPVIKARWSPRSFNPNRPVEEEKLRRLFEAARWAPSGFNEQPWRFIAGIQGDDNWKAIFSTLVSFNQEWAQNAPILVMTLGKKTLAKNGKPNASFTYDLGASVAYMTFQAYTDGLVMHQMGGFSKEKAMEAFGLSEDIEPVTVVAIGYQDLPEKLNTEMEEMERAVRTRLPIEDLVTGL
jgi:nitroreductase